MTDTHKIKNRPDIIKSNYNIFMMLHKRIFKELELNSSEIAEYAKQNGKSISSETLSRYWNQFDDRKKTIKDGITSSMSQENILWLCEHFGIEVEPTITELPMKDSRYYQDKLKK